MVKKILVIGGSGFIGSHVSDKLSNDGHKVTIFDLVKSKYISSKQKYISGNLLNKKDIFNALKGIDIIFHFGGTVDIEFSKKNPNECLLNNIIGTNNLLNAISKFKKKPKLFFGSTIYIYSNYGSFYRISKETCENLIYEYSRIYKFKYVIFRFGTVYGPRSNINNSIHKYVSTIMDNKSNKIINLNISGEEIREFIHVKDVAKVCGNFIKPKLDIFNKSFIITGLDKLKISDLIKLILEISNKKFKVNYSKKNSDHYDMTPYNFKEEISEKIFPETHIDLGLGILEMIKNYNKK